MHTHSLRGFRVFKNEWGLNIFVPKTTRYMQTMYMYTHFFLLDELNAQFTDTERVKSNEHMSQIEVRRIRFSTGFIEVKHAKIFEDYEDGH